MSMKLNTKDLSKEDSNIITNIEKEKHRAFLLPILTMGLMLIEILLDLFMNINTFIIVMITFVFSLVINTYVLYKLTKAKELTSIVLTAHRNNLNVKKLFDLNEDKVKKLQWVKVSWKTYLLEYFMIVSSAYVCVSIAFISFINQ